MQKNHSSSLKGYNPVSADARIIQIPCFPKEEVARHLADIYSQIVRDKFNDNPALANAIKYNGELNTLTHSHPLGLTLLGQIVRKLNPLFDVTSRDDLLKPEVMNLAVEEGIYLDAQGAFVLRDNAKFSDVRNEIIYEQLSRFVDNISTPVLLEGLLVRPDSKSRGYGIKLIRGPNFSYTHNQREFEEKVGKFYHSDYAVSGLCRLRKGLAACGGLADAFGDGRVVLVSRGDFKS